MADFNSITILVNGVTLALAVAFIIILLWSDSKKELNQFFATFLLFVVIWNGGALLWQAFQQLDLDTPLFSIAIGLTELGFTGASVAVYALTAVLVRAHTPRFRVLAFVSLAFIILYRLFAIFNNTTPYSNFDDYAYFQRQPLVVAFYLIFDLGTLILIWQNRRKIRSLGITLGLTLFVFGQTLGFINPELQIFQFSLVTSAVAALMVSFSIVAQEIIKPLAERNSQVEAIRRVSMAITSLASIESVLDQIVAQTAELLKTDGGVSILLLKDNELETASTFRLPKTYMEARLALGQGVAGTVALTRQSRLIDDYGRNWRGTLDYPLARETFGSVICTPLIYGGETIGVLMVIAAKQGRLFQKEDLYLLELLGAQAAVAISHSHLFSDVEYAHNQLETVLISTESPVVALDRQYRLIFANRAAKSLLSSVWELSVGASLRDLIPVDALPRDRAEAVRELRRHGTYTYEVSFGDKVYLCSLARIGHPRTTGWVAFLNDVTQLKELDRLKSEMVRMTSHDLKNPLQAAMANVELLRDDLLESSQHALIPSIDEIDWQLQRMTRIIRGVLDLERVKTGLVRLESCPPSRMIGDAVNELTQFAHSHEVRLVVDVSDSLPNVKCDFEQFKRALVNLLENAVKFTARGGTVRVAAYARENTVVFEVSDNGVGIALDVQPRIFDRFYRVQQKGTEHITGSGIGLSLVKTVVENHRGSIWLTSQEGEGSTFYISLPSAGKNSYSQ